MYNKIHFGGTYGYEDFINDNEKSELGKIILFFR